MLEIRPALPAEFPAVADVCEAAYDPYLRGDGHYRAVLRDVAAPGGGRGGARRGRRRCRARARHGHVRPRGRPARRDRRPGRTEFRMLAVDPTAQGRGVGAALLARVLDDSRGRGKTGVVCSSLPEMRAAHRVYERARVPPRARSATGRPRRACACSRSSPRWAPDAQRGVGACRPSRCAASRAVWARSARATTRYAGRVRPVGPIEPGVPRRRRRPRVPLVDVDAGRRAC